MRGATGRDVTLEDGLVYSRNTIAVQVIQAVGAGTVAEIARRMGVRESPLDEVPSLALGTSPVTLLEMASAYATIAALGEYRAPVLVTRIADGQGKVLAEFAPRPEPALETRVAVQLIDMLRGAVDRGTGRGIRDIHGIAADVAGKTGTTQNNTDGWFILMHQQLVAGAWVGFNDPRVTLRSDYWGQGGHNALHVVGDFMNEALAEGELDRYAAFPGYAGATIEAVLRRVGDGLRQWLGIGSSR
jgi:penicillin-binding protein 1A